MFNEIWRKLSNSSQIKNSGALSLDTLDNVMAWGGFGLFPLREPDKVIEIIRKAFDFLDNGEIEESVSTLLSIHQVGIASAIGSKPFPAIVLNPIQYFFLHKITVNILYYEF